MGQAGATEIEITPAMIEAGVSELRDRHFGEPLSEVVIDVFIAMFGSRDVRKAA
jgi:hypothetical protein